MASKYAQKGFVASLKPQKLRLYWPIAAARMCNKMQPRGFVLQSDAAAFGQRIKRISLARFRARGIQGHKG